MTVDEPIEETDIREILKEFLVKENLQNAQITSKVGTNVGDGYLGVTKAIDVKSDERLLQLFLKTAPKDKVLRQGLLSRLVFMKEICFYSEILPVYDEFSQKRIGKPLNLTAKCYATITEECKEALVLENLREQGFTMFDKTKLLDEEHVLIVLRNYAKFHGISYALKDQHLDIFQNLSEKINNETMTMFKNFGMKELLVNEVETLREYNDGKIKEIEFNKLEGFISRVYDFLEESVTYDDTHKIVVHGDCWMNNMLFKYKMDTIIPTEIKLLDFQLMEISLPVFDLSYFFYCSAASPENLAKLDYYLEYYYKNLSECICEFGSDLEKIYPYQTFRDHWTKFCVFGLMLTLIITKMVLSKGAEVPNVAQKVKSGESLSNVFNIKLANNDVYIERISNILKHFVSNKFI